MAKNGITKWKLGLFKYLRTSPISVGSKEGVHVLNYDCLVTIHSYCNFMPIINSLSAFSYHWNALKKKFTNDHPALIVAVQNCNISRPDPINFVTPLILQIIFLILLRL